jgi:hypothetical protein
VLLVVAYPQARQALLMTVEYPLEVIQQIARERDELRAEVKRLRTIERAARDVLTMSHLKEHAGCGPACIWRRLETACQT